MMPLANHETAPRSRKGWCWLVILLAIAGLTCSLATRTFRLSIPHGSTVQSSAGQAMRQHLDSDAAKWIPPVAVAVQIEAPSFYPKVAPAGPSLPGLLLDDPLYNRPPPSRS